MKIRLSGIVKESIVDGPGLRYTIFAQGCPHGCNGCHNPQTHDFESGKLYDIQELLLEIRSNPLLCGVTFSGGEPFCQTAEFLELAKGISGRYNIYCYTGYYFEQLLEKNNGQIDELLSYIDVLIDGPFVKSKKSHELKFKGSANQRMIDCKKSVFERRVILSEM